VKRSDIATFVSNKVGIGIEASTYRTILGWSLPKSS
jgi:hypothetical protein